LNTPALALRTPVGPGYAYVQRRQKASQQGT
jgi:hypothetical protein